jgi:hypothetical protein
VTRSQISCHSSLLLEDRLVLSPLPPSASRLSPYEISHMAYGNRKSRPGISFPTGFSILWGAFRLPGSAASSAIGYTTASWRELYAASLPLPIDLYPIPKLTSFARECDGGSSLTVTCVRPRGRLAPGWPALIEMVASPDYTTDWRQLMTARRVGRFGARPRQQLWRIPGHSPTPEPAKCPISNTVISAP